MNSSVAIVTGANSGMGLATTIDLASQGYQVIMACRSIQRGQQALQEARRQSQSERIELMILDLGDLSSIRTFAAQVIAEYPVVDVLINNAGVVNLKRKTTSDGFESMMGVNHLGHFLLTNLLLETLLRSSQGRIVVVSSGAHKSGRIDFGDPYITRGYNVWRGYANSKLANNLFTLELAERLKGTTATVNCLHPGAVGTNIGIDRDTGFGKTVWTLLRPFFLTPVEGAATAIDLAVNPAWSTVSGEYFYKKKIAPISAESKDKELARRLWEWSEQEVGGLQP